MPVRTHLLRLVSKPALPKVAVPGAGPVDRGSSIRTPRYRILSRRLHFAGRDCRHRLPKQRSGVRLSSKPHRKPCAPLLPIPNIWAPRSASSRCFTVGDRACSFIPISIASSPAAGSHPMATVWVSCRPGFFLPVRVLSRLFRRLFLEFLQKAFNDQQLHFFSSLHELQDPSAFSAYLTPLRQAKWVVYAKPPFAGPKPVLDYVGRYTHRVAISNNRLLDIGDGQVQFRYKDYRHDNQQKVMTLAADEFIRRFLLTCYPTASTASATMASSA